MSEVVVLDAVLKILYGLEYLKMKGAIPGFVLLPDVVVCEIEKPSRRKPVSDNGRREIEEPTRVLDGHAAIGAMTLAMLQDRDDGNYQVFLVAKAGPAGMELCNKFLVDRVKNAGGHPLDLCYVLQGNVDRVSRVKHTRRGLPQRRPGSLRLGHQITSFEFESLRMSKYAGKATVLALLDLQHRIVEYLFEEISTLNEWPILFADLSALDDHDSNQPVLDRLTQYGSSLDVLSASEHDVVTFASLFNGSKGASANTDDPYSAAKLLADKLGTSVLLHTPFYVALVGKTNSQRVPTFDIGTPTWTNGAGDTFNAGVMLAMAVKRALTKSLPTCPPELSLSLEECLVFGNAVAAARLRNQDYASKKDLLQFVVNAKVKDTPDVSNGVCSLRFCSEEVRELASEDVAESSLMEAMTRMPLFESILAIHKIGQRPSLSNSLWQALWQAMNSFNPNPNERAAPDELKSLAILSSLRKTVIPPVEKGERKLLFVDLDHTLFDSLESREKCAEHALQELNLRDYLWLWRLIYDDAELYKALGYPDFRQEWNTRESYEVLIALVNELGITSPELYEEHKGGHEPEKRAKFKKELTNAVTRVRESSDFANQISNVEDAVKKLPLKPYADARSFLQTVTNLGVELYLLAEGARQTQFWKTDALGLSFFFPKKRIMCTKATMDPIIVKGGLKARCQGIRMNLDKLNGEMWKAVSSFCKRPRQPDTQKQSRIVSDFARRARDMLNKRNHYLKELVYIDTINEWLDQTPEKHTEFYARCIIGISQNMEDPVPVSRSIFDLKAAVNEFNQHKHSPAFHIASIGDRPQVDANSVRSLNGRIEAIRLRIGKYINEPDGPETLRPTFQSSTLTEALCYLVRPATWSRNDVTHLSWGASRTLPPEKEKIVVEARDKSDYSEIQQAARYVLGLVKTDSNP